VTIASHIDKKQKLQATAKVGSPCGSKNVGRHLMLSYASYKHVNNTCYLTSFLGALYTRILAHNKSSDWLVSNNAQDIMASILAQFHKRKKLSGEVGETGIRRELFSGLNMLTDWVVHEQKIFKAGEYGNPIVIIERLRKLSALARTFIGF
jgi:hypothetical protein